MAKKSAIVLFSGGLDSTTCLAIAKQQGFAVYALSFDYGQRHHIELVAAKRIAQFFQVKNHYIVPITLPETTTSALTNTNLAVPAHEGNHAIPVTYVPARNTLFLAYALSLADALHIRDIFIGVSAVDYSGYPDCRPEFIHAFQTLANLATQSAIEGHSITIHAPLIHLSKAQTISTGLRLGVDYSLTVSCYQADENGYACGICDSCVLRKKGFAALNVADPTRYVS